MSRGTRRIRAELGEQRGGVVVQVLQGPQSRGGRLIRRKVPRLDQGDRLRAELALEVLEVNGVGALTFGLLVCEGHLEVVDVLLQLAMSDLGVRGAEQVIRVELDLGERI